MKKIMIMLAAVAVAVAANAGSVSWKFYDVTTVDGTDMFTGGTAYLFLATDTVTAAGAEAALQSGAFASFASSAVYTGEFEEGEFSYNNILNNEYSGSTTFFSVVVDNDANVGNYIIGENVTGNIGASGSRAFSWTYADNTGTWQAVAVPEPTSGLLLLLGMAGLALRRKKA